MNEVTYTVQIADLKALQRYHLLTSPAGRRSLIILLLVFVGISLQSTLSQESSSLGSRVLYFFVALVFTSVVGLAFFFAHNWIVQFRAYRDGESHGILGEHTITLTPDGLCERTAVNQTTANWRGIYRVVGTPQHIFIFNQPNAAHTIPRRAFASPADAEQFLATAQAYFEAARTDP